MKFGDYIRQKREKNGWTQPEAAARAGIEQSYLSKLETGKSYPSEDIFGRLVKTYDINIDDLSQKVFAAELDKLREIGEVRAVILSRQKAENRFMRVWLVAGLIMIMIGGGAFGLAYSIPESQHIRFLYRSEGVIKADESPMVFEFLAVGGPDSENRKFNDRVDYDFKSLSENKGNNFIEQVAGGYRKYSLYDTQRGDHPTAISWHYSMGIMFIFGGLACFYISRRWH
ncbi:helix-turn-helix domain-containing protein [Kordiimonas aestuarii]|uniref:helix-turn-helix domain-containing protein n=1 Tax=Kordiimonas aestuarii TaxID=1005925 RepID=UPI0021D06DBD|nr:helix-turn-helix domain-containing protein [Kordiimonas aestuarii]